MRIGTLLLGGALGAAAAYLLDPDRGRTRRARLRDQLAARARDARDEAARTGRHASNVAQGVLHETAGSAATALAGAPAEDVDDATLAARVRSEALGDPDVPEGVAMNVEGGTVVLRGELDSRDEIDALVARVRAVKGVRAVEDMLRVSGRPAPNKAAAIEASERAARDVPATGRSIG